MNPDPPRERRDGLSGVRSASNTQHSALKPQKTATLIAQRIAAQITDRQLEPGAIMASERDMLVEYGVGRGSLREALRLLELQGVIRIKPGPGGGPVVVDPSSRHLASTIALLLQMAHTPFRTIVEARQLLEPVMAEKAAERMDPTHLEELRTSVDRMNAHLDDLGLFLGENASFHDLIAWGSGNEVFGYFLSSLHWITDGTALGISYDERRRKAVHAAHERIYRAIESGDPQAAREAMQRHLLEFSRFLDRSYPSVMNRAVRWELVTS